jgi:hypothetical protein
VAVAAPRGTGGKKKKDEDNPLAVVGEVVQQVGETVAGAVTSVSPTVQGITTIERESNRTLPTKLVLSMAGLGLDDKDTVRAARVFARQFEVKPAYIFGTTDPKAYVHPVTGEPLTMREAQRFTNQFAPVAVAAMLSEQIKRTEDENLGPGRGVAAGDPRVEPEKVARWAKVVGRNGGSLRVEEGMGVAAYLARNANVTPQRFEKNLAAVKDWADTSGQPLDERSLIEVTLSMTRQARNLDSARDVFALMVGGKKQLDKIEEAARSARAEVETARADTGSDPAWLVEREGNRSTGDELLAEEQFAQYAQYEILSFTAPDLWKEVKALEGEIALREDAFDRSLLGKAINPVFRAFDQSWEWTQQGLIQLGTGLVAIPTAAGAALGLDPQGESVKENLEGLGNLNNYAFQRLKSGDTVGDLVQQGYNLPTWTAPAFDFMVGWYVDPFVIAGKAAAFRRAKRVLPGLQRPELTGNLFLNVPGVGPIVKARRLDVRAADKARFTKFITETLPQSRVTTKLFESLGSNTKFFRELDRLYGTYKSRGVFDYEYMKLLRDRVLARYAVNGVIPPQNTEEALKAFREGVTAHYTGWAPEGTVAAEVVDARRTRMVTAADDLEPPPEGIQLDIYDELHTPEEIVSSTIQETIRGTDRLLPFSVEAPSVGFLADIGPRRVTRSILTSPKVTKTDLGRRGARLISQNPGRMANIEDGFEEYVVLHGRRWGQFDERQVRMYQSKATEILNSGYGREQKLMDLIDEMNEAGIRSVAKNFNISPEATDDFVKDALEFTRSQNRTIQSFGVVDGRAVSNPLFESQLKNTFVVVDPIEVLNDLRQFVGMRNKLSISAKKSLGTLPKEIRGPVDDILSRTTTATWELMLRGGRFYQRGWKALTVARPGYIPRVILGDENARFLATTESLAERLIAQEWGPLGRWMDERGLFDEVVDLGDGATITLKRPGAYEREPLATGKVRETELLAETLRKAGSTEKALRNGSVSWDVISATHDRRAHLEAWVWALKKQFVNSGPGRIALESVQRGGSIEDTRRALLTWAKEDKYVTLTTRIGRPASEAEEWASVTSRLVHGYTMGRSDIARLTLAGDDDQLRAVLDGVKRAERPPVHGPTIVQNTATADGQFGSDFTNFLYRKFVRQPEDILNRQPFYKTWFRRAQRGYYELLGGKTGSIADAVKPQMLKGTKRIVEPDMDLIAAGARATPGDAGGYVYHITSPDNFESIRKAGLKPQQSFYGVAADAVPAEMRRGRVFFADSIDRALDLGRKGGDDYVAFRVRAEAVGDTVPERSFSGSQFGHDPVDPKTLEYLGADNKWHPAVGTLHPDIQRAIDVASRDFALGQVRRIMFDFTRQSRFTELLQFAFPFPQPFFEGFQAWGHIAWRNPEAIGRAQALYRLAKDSGFIREDPVTGEQVVAMGVYMKGARLAALLPGIDKKSLEKLGLSMVAPLSSFNMLAASTLKVPSNGILGRVAGGMPIPVPGMNVPLQWVAQQVFADSSNEALMSWLFQYGPNTSALPSSVKRVANILNPGFIKEGREESYALAIMERWQQLGLDRDEEGKVIPPVELAKLANEVAEDLAAVQGFVSLISPAALRVQFGTEELKKEWGDLLDDENPLTGGDYTKARDIWDERHEDLPLIPIANTFYTDPEMQAATGEDVQAGYEGANAPRIPASPFTDAMLKEPGIGEFMRNNPEWAALVLVGVDPAALESQDFSAFAKQIADHLVAYRDPLRFAQEGQDDLAWKEIDDFYTQVWNPGMDRVEKKGLDPLDDFYQGLIQARQEAFLSVGLEFPDFAIREFEPVYDRDDPTKLVGYDWAFGGGEGKRMKQVLEDARRIATTPGMENVPGFRALNAYLDLRDDIFRKMSEKNLNYIDQDGARPYWKEYEKGVKDILEQAPAFEAFAASYFGINFDDDGALISTDDLMGQHQSARQQARVETDPQLLALADAFDTRIEQLRDKAFRSEGAEVSFERSELYLRAQRTMDSEDPEVVAAWWKVQDPTYKKEYKLALATKPPEFYTRHDWSLLGVELSENATEWFLTIAESRVEIGRREQEAPGTYSEAAGYEDIDRFVKGKLGQDKSFDKAVKELNRWSFPVEATGYTSLPGKTGEAWRELARILNVTQGAVDAAGLIGINYGSEADKNRYGGAQNAMKDWVDDTRKRIPGFRRTWDRMKEEYGDVLIGDVFIPDNYFGKLGVVD